eukprot:s1813_g2.t1
MGGQKLRGVTVVTQFWDLPIAMGIMAVATLCLLGAFRSVTATHRIYLERREVTNVNVTDVMLDIRSRREKHQASLPSWLPIGAPVDLLSDEKAKLVVEPMDNIANMQYLGKMYIGTPSQEVRLVFDTGSSDLWVWSERFSRDVSITWEPTDYQVTIHYGSGIASGYYGLDRVCLDSSPPLCVYRQPLFLAQELIGIPMQAMDGLVGMGFVGISHVHRTFLRDLNESFEDMSFAFKLTSQGDDRSFVVFGNYDEVMKEGYAQTGISHEDVLFAPVVDLFRIPDMQGLQAGWWLVEMTAQVHGHPTNLLKLRLEYFFLDFLYLMIWLGCILGCRRCRDYWNPQRAKYKCFVWTCRIFAGFCYLLGVTEMLLILYNIFFCAGTFEPKTIYAALDTGTSLLSVPIGVLAPVGEVDFIPMALAMFGDHYWFSCSVQAGSLVCFCDVQDKVRPLGFEIGGKEFWLRPSEMFFEIGKSPDGKAVCMTGLSGNVQPFWILGDVFLRQAFVVHGYNRREVALFPYSPQAPELLAEDLPWRVGPAGGLLLALPLALLLALKGGVVPQRDSFEEPLLEPKEILRDFTGDVT